MEDRFQETETELRDNSLAAALRETLVLLVTAIALAWFIYTFVIQTFWIPSGSMEPTIMPGDRVLVAKFYYRLTEPKRGDIIVFPSPEKIGNSEPDLIKRVIATPGEFIKERNGKVYINDKLLIEPYALPDRPGYGFESYKVPKDKLFVMGDNRANSRDSRFLGPNNSFYPVDRDQVVGRAFFTYWPPNRIGILR